MTEPTIASVAARLRPVLRDGLSPAPPDVVFGPGEREIAMARLMARQGILAQGKGVELRPAAVLIPLVARAEGVTVLLTQRTPHLAAHAGQISFPGGRLEPEDADVRAAALRETREEIGLSADRITILGQLEEYGTVTGFRVTPVVGIVTPPFVLTPDPTEVAATFEMPLSHALDPVHWRHAIEQRDGIERDIYEIAFETWRIWGFTARLLVRLTGALIDPGKGTGAGPWHSLAGRDRAGAD